MDTDFYGPALPPKYSQNVQSELAFKQSDLESNHSEYPSESEHPKKVVPKAKKHSDAQGKGKILFSVVFFRGR